MGKPLHVEVLGHGHRDIVVCAGASQTTVNWKGLIRAYPNWRWILFDARGQGQSPMRTPPYGIDDHVSDLMEVTQKTNAKKPIVLGFSHGGHVALRAAALHPYCFSQAILVSCTSRTTAQRDRLLQSWAQCLRSGGVAAFARSALPTLVGPRILDQFPDAETLVHAMVRRNNAPGLEALFQGIMSYPRSWEEDCRKIQIPVHFIRGELDPLIDEKDTQNFDRWIHYFTTEVLPGCGHTAILEDPLALTLVLGADRK